MGEGSVVGRGGEEGGVKGGGWWVGVLVMGVLVGLMLVVLGWWVVVLVMMILAGGIVGGVGDDGWGCFVGGGVWFVIIVFVGQDGETVGGVVGGGGWCAVSVIIIEGAEAVGRVKGGGGLGVVGGGGG